MRALLVVVMAVASTFIATAYGPPWDSLQGSGTTATGIKLPAAPTNQIIPIVAVDPSVIPLGTQLKITPNPFGDPNLVFTAADTGGAIKGNRIDFLDMAGRISQNAWGKQPVTISIVGKGSANNVPAASSTPSSPSSSTSSGGGVSDWEKLLLDGTFLAFGALLTWRGTRRMLTAQGSN